MSNEKQIREEAKKYLLEQFNGIIIDEFKGGDMITRPDLACINHEAIIMCEIKGNKDTLTRLENQVKDYFRVANVVILFLDIVHKDKYEKMKDKLPYHYLLWFNNGIIEKQYNFWIKPFKIDIFHLLWAKEKTQLLKIFKGFSSIGNCKYTEYIFAIYAPNEIIKYSFELFYERWLYISKQEQRFCKGYLGATLKSKIEYLEYKQILFDNFKKELKEQKQKAQLEYERLSLIKSDETKALKQTLDDVRKLYEL